MLTLWDNPNGEPFLGLYCGAVIKALVDACIFPCDVSDDECPGEVVCPVLMDLLFRFPHTSPEQSFGGTQALADTALHLQGLPLLHLDAFTGVYDRVALGGHCQNIKKQEAHGPRRSPEKTLA